MLLWGLPANETSLHLHRPQKQWALSDPASHVYIFLLVLTGDSPKQSNQLHQVEKLSKAKMRQKATAEEVLRQKAFFTSGTLHVIGGHVTV